MSYFEFFDFSVKCLNFLKNPKGGPFYVKKIFISDLAQILCVDFLGLKGIKFQISWKSEMKIFLR